MPLQNKRKSEGDVGDEYSENLKRAKTAKSGPSKHRAKDFENQTEEEKNARSAQDRKGASKGEVNKRVPWKYNPSYVTRQGTETITKTNAKETYKLNDGDLESLPYEQRKSVRGFKMKLYSLPDVKNICRSKNGFEILDEAENLVEYLTKSHDESGAPTARIARLTKAGRDIFGEREENEARKNREDLMDCLRLWVPDYAETVASYEPPTFECTKPSLPDNFATRPGSRLITELEAMNLFLLRRCELEGLERKSINTDLALDLPDGLDYNEVQQRAMDCHGGFEGHNRNPIALKKSSKTSELDEKTFLEVWVIVPVDSPSSSGKSKMGWRMRNDWKYTRTYLTNKRPAPVFQMLSNESTPTSASDLPQEIIDSIVDEFFIDTITLRLCSTLCRSFSSRARVHLFQTIHLTPSKCSKFESTCLSSPEIPSLVKHISFSEFRTNPCRARKVVGATINLEQISFMNCDLLPFAQFFGELEPARRTSVTHVSIQSWGLRFKEICLLLEQFPSTDTLGLEGQTVKAHESKAFVETFIGKNGVPIRSLDLRISQELNPFIDCFRSVGNLDIPFSVSRLRYLSVDFLDAFLKETSHTLEELQFICCDYPYH
ncbi:hypothetical protein IW262DRAFT_1297811 [Armillaria fumosa]|nr:hypothetical protein IW262DRAFT_1297811 [Armillaria fumosa]